MNFWQRLRLSFRQSTGWLGPYGMNDKALAELFGAKPVASGVAVNEDKALTASAVWACVQLIAGTLGTLPLIHYRVLANGGRERASDTRLYRLLHDTPNDEMTSSTFFETLGTHLLLWGNGFAEIRRNARGEVAALYIIEPWRVRAERDEARRLRYRIDGETLLRPDEMLHVPGLTPDGIWGYSPIQKAREAVGLLLAAERFGGVFFGQGSSFGGVLTHPARLSETAEANLRKSLEMRGQGVDRAHQFIILQEGMRYDKLGVPPNDAQFLETRKFQVDEIARWFGVPPHMIGDTERTTSWGTGIEQQAIGFVKFTMRRWLVRIEDEIERKLISPLERKMQMVEFLVDGLERGDFQSRVNAYVALRQAGLTTPNRIAALENWEPFGAAGDQLLVPLSLGPSDVMPSMKERIEAVGGLVRAGYDPADSLKAVDLPPLGHVGAPPVTVQPQDNYPGAATRGGGGGFGQPANQGDGGPEPAPANDQAPRALPVVELKALPPADLSPVLAKLEALEAVPPPDFTPILAKLEALGVEHLAVPPPDLAPVLAKLEALETERRADAERVAALVPRVQLMVEDVARDFVRREADRARRAGIAADKLAAWIEEFYPRQADYAVKVFRGPMQVYTQLVGRADDAEQDIRTRIAPYLAESRDALAALSAAPADDVKLAVARLMDRWEADRPAELARALMGGSSDLIRRAAIVFNDERESPTPIVIEKEIIARDANGRAQRMRETATDDGVTLIVEKEVVERDSAGRAQKIRETHVRKR